MRRMVAAEKGETENDVPDEPPPLNHDADYAIDTWLERRNHHLYPELGGYNDQDALLMEDWRALNLYHIRAHAGVYSAVELPHDARPWQDLMKD